MTLLMCLAFSFQFKFNDQTYHTINIIDTDKYQGSCFYYIYYVEQNCYKIAVAFKIITDRT